MVTCRVVRVRVDVESYRPGSMSSRTGPGRCRVVSVRADVESYGPVSMSSRTGPYRCGIVRAQADVELFGPGPNVLSSGLGPMSSCPVPGLMSCRLGSGRCRAERARSMSIRPGLGRCRVVRAWANVDSSGPRPMSSRPGPG